MTIARARIIKGRKPAATDATTRPRDASAPIARVVPRVSMEAREEAARIVADARAKAEALVLEARANAARLAAESAREAREREVAKVAAELLVVRAAEERRRTQEIDRTIEIARLLAERVIGEGLRIEPERIAVLATEALRETRGARQVRIEASPEDVAPLEATLAELGVEVAAITPSSELGRGSLVVHTELGRVDARLEPQLARLSGALREALAGSSIQGSGGGSAKG
jgi:flagellar biosynthesis/type III secretory pathway protein FliH